MSISARIITEFSSIDPRAWDQLDTAENPFLDYAFLSGLEQTGSIGAHAGWYPRHLALYEDGKLVGFAPAYAKSNSHGEFVFDWAWADAYHRNGLDYYPKLLTGVPYTPVTGPRLLTAREHPAPAEIKNKLKDLALQECAKHGYSTWHSNFLTAEESELLRASNLLHRTDWQFHWTNRDYSGFDEFLADLRSRKRKSIRRERRQVASSGIRVIWKTGRELDSEDLGFVYTCYLNTFRQYGNYPALKPEFFAHLAEHLDEGFQVALACREEQPVAMAVFLAGGGTLYGRYWGCTEEIPGLHFEVAYYQGIEFCIRNGIGVFESGAQGEHKIGRGFTPVQTQSCHYIANPLFRNAIADHLQREHQWIEEYYDRISDLSPFRRDLE